MKEVIKLIETHVRERRLDAHQGLNAVLDFLVDIFDVRHYLTENGWFEAVSKAEKEEPYLYKVMLIWMDKVATSMENGSWLDFFGGVYEEMYQSRGKASTLGQFFTPPHLCTLMSRITKPNDGTINDCACGSGRTLLAAGAEAKFSRSNYYVGEDLDLVSVKMCALNLMIHGCKGRVVQHDTIMNPICYDYGFRINDIRFPIPTPFYSLTRIRFTKDDLDKANQKIKNRCGDNVYVNKYVHEEVLTKADKGVYPISTNQTFQKEEVSNERYSKPIQLDLFG